MKLAWAFAFPDTSTLRSQPAVYRGRVFAGGQDGSVYALDAATGCVYWASSVESQVRSGIAVGEVGGNPVVFFGDSAGYLYALDGTSGKQLWKMRPDEHPAATQTSTPVFYKGRLYVGSASREESLSISPGYLCCTFRGSESAIDAATGKVLWKRYMIPEVAKDRPKSRRGAKVSGPSGAGIWTAATLDPEHDAVYVVTGDNYSDPPTALSDALVALKMSTGEILWSKQFTAKDVYNSSCQLADKVNCPDTEGPGLRFCVAGDPGFAAQWTQGFIAGAEVGSSIRCGSRPARASAMADSRGRGRSGGGNRVGLGERRAQHLCRVVGYPLQGCAETGQQRSRL